MTIRIQTLSEDKEGVKTLVIKDRDSSKRRYVKIEGEDITLLEVPGQKDQDTLKITAEEIKKLFTE